MSKLFLSRRLPPDYNQQAWSDILRQIETLNNSQVDGYLFPVTKITASDSPFSVSINDSFIPADASGGGITVTLKPAAEAQTKRLTVKKIDSSSNEVTISGSETIDGEATAIIDERNDSICLMSDGVEWWIV